MLSACLHGITHTPYTFISWQWIVTGATHITHKTQNTLRTSKSALVPADHPSLIRHAYGIHCTMTQSTFADYMLKSAVP